MKKCVSSRKLRPIALRVLSALSVASLTACVSLQEEFAATSAAKVALGGTPQVGPKLPDLPNDIRICLMRQACQPDAQAKGKAKTKAASAPKPECQTDDGLVLEYVQTDAEKRACTAALLRWYRKQQEIQGTAAKDANVNKHPRSGAPAQKAGWP